MVLKKKEPWPQNQKWRVGIGAGWLRLNAAGTCGPWTAKQQQKYITKISVPPYADQGHHNKNNNNN